jgi:hypothetical protein
MGKRGSFGEAFSLRIDELRVIANNLHHIQNPVPCSYPYSPFPCILSR